MKSITVVSVLCLAMIGCTSSHVIIGTVRPEIDPSEVYVYSYPPLQFEEVAILTASSKNPGVTIDQGKTNVIERFKKEAAALGANGVILSGLQIQQRDVVGFDPGNTHGNTAYIYGTGTTVYASETHRSVPAIAIYVPNVNLSAPDGESELDPLVDF